MLSNNKMLGPVVEFPSYTTQFQPTNIFCRTSSGVAVFKTFHSNTVHDSSSPQEAVFG